MPVRNNRAMSNPFLPGSGDGSFDPEEQLAALLRQLGITPGPNGEIDVAALMQQVQSQLGSLGLAGFPGAGGTGSAGVNWERTKQMARQVTASLGADPTPTSLEQRAVADAGRLADMWLDPVCSFPSLTTQPVAWSRAEWVENSMPAWQEITEPIVTSIAAAMGGLLQSDRGQLPEELAGFSQMLTPMLNQMATTMYSVQLAQAIGQLSNQVLTGTEIGMQLLPQARTIALPAAINTFRSGLNLSENDLLLYLVLRETARQRLFAGVAWLAPQLLALVRHYAREIKIDAAALESAIDVDDFSGLTPEKMMEVSQQLQGKLFEPTRTEEQEGILERLETVLALIEGWVDEITAQAARDWMPAEAQLSETIRRRRGSGGPAEAAFKSLVGLELHPRRVREAAALWAQLREARGIEGRDQVWQHPDLIPDAAALSDPAAYLAGGTSQGVAPEMDALDLELQKLLEGSGEDKPDAS